MKKLIFFTSCLFAFAAPSHAENPAPVAGYWEALVELKTTFVGVKTITKTRKCYGFSNGSQIEFSALDEPLENYMFGAELLTGSSGQIYTTIVEDFSNSVFGTTPQVSFKSNEFGQMISFKIVDESGEMQGNVVPTFFQVITVQGFFKKAFPQ